MWLGIEPCEEAAGALGSFHHISKAEIHGANFLLQPHEVPYKAMSIKSARQLLEEALIADFEDLTVHAAYADLLMEESNPRGEYIRMLLAAEDASRSTNELIELRQRAAELLQTYEQEWLGSLAPFLAPRRRGIPEPVAPNHDARFRRGWLVALEVQAVRSAFLQVLARAPEARLLQELALADTRNYDHHTSLDPLLQSPYLGAIRYFCLGDPEAYFCTAEGSQCVALAARLPRLESLTVLAWNVDTPALFALPMPNLTSLHIRYAELIPLKVLASNASLTRLSHLFLDGSSWSGVLGLAQTNFAAIEAAAPQFPQPEDVRALVRSPHLGSLSRLHLRLPGLGDAGCEEIVRSGILRRLERLDLRFCSITDAGAAILASSP